MFRQQPLVARAVVATIAALALSVPASGQSLSAAGQTSALKLPPALDAQVGQAAPAGPVRRLTVDEAVVLALEQNLSIQIERLNPQIQDLGVAQARSAWTPTVSSGFQTRSQDSPSNSFLSGGQVKVSDDLFATTVGVDHLLPWGGSYSVAWDNSRTSTTNIFTNFDPILRSNVSVTYVQPLVRNFSLDGPRQQLLVTRKNREISDVQLRQTVVATIRSVKNAYWDLVYAISSLSAQQQSLDLARESLRNNQIRVEVGTMAPIDIVEAQAEVARNEEAVIVAEAAIRQAEDRLRALIMDPATPDFWNVRLEPTDTPQSDMRPIDVDAAVRNALDKRTDLVAARKNLETADVNVRYFRNQTLPDVNVSANYSLAGLGGTRLVRGDGFPGPIIGQVPRGFGTVLGDIVGNDFPTWVVGVSIGYPIGTSSAEANVARARLEHSQGQIEIKNLELQIASQVRDVGRQVNTNLKRVEATRAARRLAERRLEAEQKKFSVGMSTSFLVFQAQRDLAAARNGELRAIVDYNRSLVDFEAVQEAAIGGGIQLAPTGRQ